MLSKYIPTQPSKASLFLGAREERTNTLLIQLLPQLKMILPPDQYALVEQGWQQLQQDHVREEERLRKSAFSTVHNPLEKLSGRLLIR